MAEITVLEVSEYPVVASRVTGSEAPRKRSKVFVRGTAAAAGDFISLGDYLPGVDGIEGVSSYMVNHGLESGTANLLIGATAAVGTAILSFAQTGTVEAWVDVFYAPASKG